MWEILNFWLILWEPPPNIRELTGMSASGYGFDPLAESETKNLNIAKYKAHCMLMMLNYTQPIKRLVKLIQEI